MKFPFFKKRCSRIERYKIRKISYEEFVNDVHYQDENVDDYDGTVVVMVVVEIEVTILPTWRQ